MVIPREEIWVNTDPHGVFHAVNTGFVIRGLYSLEMDWKVGSRVKEGSTGSL